jgi:hypothetical protein
MFTFLKKWPKELRTYRLIDGWSAEWIGPENFVLSKGDLQYGIFAPKREGTCRRIFTVKDMPPHWFPPNDKESLSVSERELLIQLSVEVIKAGHEDIEIVRD